MTEKKKYDGKKIFMQRFPEWSREIENLHETFGFFRELCWDYAMVLSAVDFHKDFPFESSARLLNEYRSIKHKLEVEALGMIIDLDFLAPCRPVAVTTGA